MRPEESETRWLLRMLQQDLQTLASDAETLIQAFPPTVLAADEVALEFAEHLEFGDRFVDEGLLTPEKLELVRSVDRFLSKMSDRHELSLWTNEAVRKREEWREVRRRARHALATMGYNLEPPPAWNKRMKIIRARTADGTRA